MHAETRNRGRRPVRGRRADGTRGGGMLAPFAGLFHRMLDRIDRGLDHGTLEATLPDGTWRRLGGRGDGPVAVVDLKNWRALIRLATGGSAGWYEAWALGEWASPDPVPLFDLFMRNRAALGQTARARGSFRLTRRLIHWLHRNSKRGARRNIRYHYDLGNDFYTPWLDASMTYSSALFAYDAMTLADGQAAKLAAILDRTGAKPGDHILEIGCGWGSFLAVAARAGCRVTGLTLSTEQRDCATARLARGGLGGVEIALTDYRDVTGTYDAVASIEMVEAVGQDYWGTYLETIARVLKPGGRAGIQYIAIDDAIFDAYAANVDFIQAHVFPGGMLLSEKRFRALAEANGLRWEDRQGFGQDYARTLRLWRERFDAAVSEGRLPEAFDRDFIALWRYYLMYCEGGFSGGGIEVAQVTLVKG